MNTISKPVSSSASSSDVSSLRGAGSRASGTGVVVNNNAVRQTAAITGNMLLAQMKPGDSFAGDIIDVRGSYIKLLLAGDKTLEATSSESKNLNIGDHLKFSVTSNNGKTVVIKPLSVNTFNTNVLLKALEAAEVSATDRNIQVVKAMMNNEMSINKGSLSEMIKNVENLKPQDPASVVAMVRHGIPLSAENVSQFEAYKNYEHRLIAQAESVAENIPELIKNMIADGDENGATGLAKSLINILSENIPEQQILSSTSEGTVVIKSADTQIVSSEQLNGLASNGDETVNVNNLTDDDAFLQKMGLSEDGAVFEASNKTTEDRQLLSKEQVINNLNTLKGQELKEFIESADFKDFVKDKVEKGFELNVNKLGDDPEEVKANVKKLYENFDGKTEAILNALENAGQRDTTLGNTTSNMRNNMQFMQDLSQMAAYIQLPVKLNESKAHGDLYVFNRKKGMPVDKDVVTAFLHLDLDNLGATDIHVTLEKQSLKTEFSLEDNLSMQIVESHLEELKERLEKKGFTTTITVEMQQKDEVNNPFDRVLETDKPQISIKRYSFDVRA